MRVCFFANVGSKDLNRIDFYSNDLRILADLGYEVVVAETVREVLRIKNVDVYYVWWWNRALFPILAARFRCAKVVVCGVFDYFLPFPTRYDFISRPAWQRWMLRTALKKADANIFICQYEFDLISRFFEVNEPRMIYLAIDSRTYVERLMAPQTKRVLNIAWTGTENARRKSLFEIVEAIPLVLMRHSDAIFEFGGRDGDALLRLKARVQELNIAEHVIFLGELTHSEKLDAFNRADLYLQPSMYEGFGSAVAEAMACGVPAVTTTAGALPEVMAGGEFAASPQPGDIAVAVNRFFDMPPHVRSEKGRQAAAHVRDKFSYENRKSRLRACLEAL